MFHCDCGGSSTLWFYDKTKQFIHGSSFGTYTLKTNGKSYQDGYGVTEYSNNYIYEVSPKNKRTTYARKVADSIYFTE